MQFGIFASLSVEMVPRELHFWKQNSRSAQALSHFQVSSVGRGGKKKVEKKKSKSWGIMLEEMTLVTQDDGPASLKDPTFTLVAQVILHDLVSVGGQLSFPVS